MHISFPFPICAFVSSAWIIICFFLAQPPTPRCLVLQFYEGPTRGPSPCSNAVVERIMGDERGGEERMDEKLKVQAVAFDYYMTKPTHATPQYQKWKDLQEEVVFPVIRVFGPTPGKQKACVHVHGVLPYMYVQYQKDWPQLPSAARNQLKQFALALDTAMSLAVSATEDGSLALDAQGNEVKVDVSVKACSSLHKKCRRRNIAMVSLVRATPFYGYHGEDSLFVKISYFNPSIASRLAAVLRGGSVLNAVYMPFEAHIPFLMQFALDFNLHGMDFIELAHPRFRAPVPSRNEPICTPCTSTIQLGTQWTVVNIPEAWKWQPPVTMPRQASCDIEVDVQSQDIANSLSKSRVLSKDGEDRDAREDDEPILPSLGLLWEDECKRCLAAGTSPPERKTKLWREAEGRFPEPLIPDVEETVRQAFKKAVIKGRPSYVSVSAFPQLAVLAPPANSINALVLAETPLCVDVLNDLIDLKGSDEFLDITALMTQLTQENKPEASPPCRYSTDDNELADLLEWIRNEEEGLHSFSEKEVRNEQMEEEPASQHAPSMEHHVDEGTDDEDMDYWQASQAEVHDIVTCNAPDDNFNTDNAEEDPREDQSKANDGTPLTPELNIEEVDDTHHSHKRVRFHLESPTFSPQKDVPVFPGLIRRSQLYSSRSMAIQNKSVHSPKALFQGQRNGSKPAKLQRNLPVAIRLQHRRPPRVSEKLQSAFQAPPPMPPFYGNPSDAPTYPMVIAGKSFAVRTSKVAELQPFGRWHASAMEVWQRNASTANSPDGDLDKLYPLSVARGPPRVGKAQLWLQQDLNQHRSYPPGNVSINATLEVPGRPSSPKYDERYGLVQIGSSVQSGRWEDCSSSDEERMERSCLVSSQPSEMKVSEQRHSILLQHSSLEKKRLSFASNDRSKIGCSPSETGSPRGTNNNSQQGLALTGLAGSISLLTIASVEIYASCRTGKLPDPTRDAVHCVALCVYDPGTSCDELRTCGPGANTRLYLYVYDQGLEHLPRAMQQRGYLSDALTEMKVFPSEVELLQHFTETLRLIDPDVVVGFDLERSSLGYLHQRVEKLQLYQSFLQAISRAPSMQATTAFPSKGDSSLCLSLGGGLGGGGGPQEELGSVPSSTTWCPGRVLLNLWRIFRSSISTLRSFSLHACAKELLQTRVPTFPPQPWPRRSEACIHVIGNTLFRAKINLSMLIASGSLPRAAELARVLGLDIASVFTRGSQRRVEAVSCRLLRAAGYLPPSPSAAQVAGQPAMVQLPLVMEPEAGAYEHPVAVLDFESLYPSLMIAYNLCYSTALGQAETWTSERAREASTWPIGCGRMPAPTAGSMREEAGIVVSPSKAAFVPRATRVGVLPRMLSEILSTRRMIKAAAKRIYVPEQSSEVTPNASESIWTPARQSFADTKALAARLDGQQLALKLLANVTYGYAAAGFSGHMPMAELADAIVSLGRAAASAAKRRIEGNLRWNAQVVYGDSVMPYTPVLVRNKRTRCVSAMAIEHLARDWMPYEAFHEGDPRRCEKEQGTATHLQAWTDKGWADVRRVVRHKCSKKIYRVVTHTGLVDVTEDHSLLLPDRSKVRPHQLEVGTALLHAFPKLELWPHMLEAGTPEQAYMFGVFVGNGSCAEYDGPSGRKYPWAINNSDITLINKWKTILEMIHKRPFQIVDTLKSSGVYKLVPTEPSSDLVTMYRQSCYDNAGAKVVPDEVLNGQIDHVDAFIEGLSATDGCCSDLETTGCRSIDTNNQISAQHYYVLLKRLGYQVSIDAREDKTNTFCLTWTVEKQRREATIIKKQYMLHQCYGGFVYDLETSQGVFQAGVGELIVKNTDSLFVHFPGRTLAEAFQLAEEIATDVTRSNLPPIRLKLDKVFLPCVLIAKKRYVGMAATCAGAKPTFDAKGIETVRRDTCPYAAYALERCLRVFFNSKDLSRVRRCAQRAFSRALNGEGRMQDYILAKEIRAGGHYRGTRPPAAVVAAKRAARDPQDRALRGERVAYVVVAGAPGSRLVDRVSPPEDLFLPSQNVRTRGTTGSQLLSFEIEVEEEESEDVAAAGHFSPPLSRRRVPLQLHGMYYASKQLAPALDRVFRLVGADVQAWLRETPRRSIHHRGWGSEGALPQLFARAVREGLDPRGMALGDIDARANHLAMTLRSREAAARRWRARRACASCISAARCSTVDARAPSACHSFGCPVFYARYDPGH